MKVDYIDHMGDDLTVVNAARVSFDKQSKWDIIGYREEICKNPEDRCWYQYPIEKLKAADEKLINYLAKHKHMSPFGHCFVSVRVTAPVFVARQLVKHEYLRMNEISRRYVDSEPEFYIPEVWRNKAKDKKQGSGEGAVEEIDLGLGTALISEQYRMHVNRSLGLYNDLIRSGVAPEQARMVLPQSMMTSWYWSGSLDAFAKMYNLRAKEDTQWETRQIANQIGDIIAPLFPVSWESLTKE